MREKSENEISYSKKKKKQHYFGETGIQFLCSDMNHSLTLVFLSLTTTHEKQRKVTAVDMQLVQLDAGN